MSAKPSAKDEAAFMEQLLSGIDSSFFDNALSPSPNPTPKKRKRAEQFTRCTRTPCKKMPISVVSKNLRNMEPPAYDASANSEIAALLDGAEDWDWDAMLSPVKKKPKSGPVVPTSPSTTTARETMLRCVVKSVEDSLSTKANSNIDHFEQCVKKYEQELHVVTENKMTQKRIELKDDWAQTEIQPGDTVNIIGDFSLNVDSITISSKCNLLIQHPDILLTATSIANSLHCSRKPLLSLLLRSWSDKSRPLVWGSILHEVMQRCLSTGSWDESAINSFIDEGIRKHLMDLLHLDVGVEEARVEIIKRAIGLKAFGEKFVSRSPKRDAIVKDTRTGQEITTRLAVLRLHDVEEEIWAPKYGLKGKIDASLRVRMDEYAEPRTAKHKAPLPQPRTTTTDMPLEIKTGLAVAGAEHRAQTMLYALLMADRYGTVPPIPLSTGNYSTMRASGLLFYTQTEDLIRVAAGWNELRSLIIARNELASYLMRRTRRSTETTASTAAIGIECASPFLPPTIDQERACSRCYVSDACMLYRKAVENVEDKSSSIADLYELKTGHLTQEQLNFFKDWENLITLEEHDMTKFRKELWTSKAEDLEKSGKCLANMILDTTFSGEGIAGNMHIHRYTYRFIRHKRLASISASNQSLLHGHISSGDPIVISVSDDPRLIALARGFVLELTPKEIVVGVDHSFSADFIESRPSSHGPGENVVFRIDKDDMMGGMGRVRDNLAQLFYASGSRRLLQCIVDLQLPEFRADANVQAGGFGELNENQVHALTHALRAKDYALILGMPGTGKTTTVAHMIRMMVQMGKTVLLTSYTHSAVDSILLKLKDVRQFEILRLGNRDKVHPEIQEFTLDARETPATVEQLKSQLLRPPVVATTALSIDHALFSRRRFDYCIVDEASQITLPTCVGPLRLADIFILVGDHFQLPPLVKSKKARKAGFDVSLFRRLSDAHPQAVVDLTFQYRMNADIMLLSNKLIYSDRLKCGSSDVADRTLRIPRRRHDCSCGTNGADCWIQKIMDETCKAVFVDTDAIPALDSRVGDLIQNEREAWLVQQLTVALLEGGVREDQIGIISLYRQQIKLLSHLLQEHKGIELLTADKSQGRDKDCIIISLVRANKDNQIGDLLKDWRRVNVAFTRARAKLVIFGSRKTLKASPLLSDFCDLMEVRGWVLTLPEGSDIVHSGQSANSMSRVGNPKAHSKIAAQPKKAKPESITNGLLRSRPILRDILNDSK